MYICKKLTSLQLCDVFTTGRCDDISPLKQQNHLGNLRWGYAYGVLTSWL